MKWECIVPNKVHLEGRHFLQLGRGPARIGGPTFLSVLYVSISVDTSFRLIEQFGSCVHKYSGKGELAKKST